MTWVILCDDSTLGVTCELFVMIQLYVCHSTRFSSMCDVSDSMWWFSSTRDLWVICDDLTLCVTWIIRHNSALCVTCESFMNRSRVTSPSTVWNDSFLCATRYDPSYTTVLYAWQDSFLCVTCLSPSCAISYFVSVTCWIMTLRVTHRA